MTVSSACSNSGVNATDMQTSFKQTRADFQALDAALQSGDLTSAQQAFAQLQKDNPRLAQAVSSAPSSSDSPRIADLKSLASALQSGDVNSAQQAFAKLQKDSQAVAGHHHHHHPAAASAPDATSTSGADSDGDNDGSTSAGSVSSGSVLDASA